ncbi:MAG: metalloregulator ArsR/SmtB family transcription factor [Acidimicrobiia bacterium]
MADSDVFSALGDPTRRQLVDWLAEEGSGTATRFAERLPISRQAVARHLQELEKAGVVDSTRFGRETRFVLRPEPLTRAAGWLDARAAAWDRTLARLEEHLR